MDLKLVLIVQNSYSKLKLKLVQPHEIRGNFLFCIAEAHQDVGFSLVVIENPEQRLDASMFPNIWCFYHNTMMQILK